MSFYAVDAAGNSNCSSTPKIFAPPWTATTGARLLPSPAEVNGLADLGSSDYSFNVFGLSQDLIRRPFFRQLWVRCAWRTWPTATGSTLS